MTNQKDRIQNAINHIKSSVDIDPWAMEIAVEAMRKELERSGQSENQDVTDINVGSTDVISRQAAIDALEKVAELFPWRIPGNCDSYDHYNEAWNDAIGRAEIEIEKLPSAQLEPDHFRETSKMIWHECDPDDPSSFPDDDRNVLVSFSNFSVPMLGQWRVDPDESGNWYEGDSDETFLSADLYVDGWWELPKKPEAKMELTEP